MRLILTFLHFCRKEDGGGLGGVGGNRCPSGWLCLRGGTGHSQTYRHEEQEKEVWGVSGDELKNCYMIKSVLKLGVNHQIHRYIPNKIRLLN